MYLVARRCVLRMTVCICCCARALDYSGMKFESRSLSQGWAAYGLAAGGPAACTEGDRSSRWTVEWATAGSPAW